MDCQMKLTSIFTLHLVFASLCWSQGYYPLRIGDRWDYGYLSIIPGETNHFVYQRTIAVLADTVFANGNTYSVLSDGSLNRQHGDTVFKYSSFRGEEILYDLSRQNGDTMVTYLPHDTLTSIVHRGTSTVFGKLRTRWTFDTRSSRSSFYSIIGIADSIGYVHGQWEPGENEYCLGAIINGVQYGTITGVTPVRDAISVQFLLCQNYPNPFNPSTAIGYGLPVRSHVSLAVYNTLGQQVAVLQNGEQEAGYHDVRFDASTLPSGVYFYRLQAGSYVETRRLCLVR
jgi:hypothetical protein